jgi:PPIC-type PPIASE domain
MRLDEGDTIVRRRLAQKLEFLLQDTAKLVEPTENELRGLYDAEPEAYRTEARVSFTQIYFSRERRRDAARDAADTLTKLAATSTADVGDLGDRLLIEAEFRTADRQVVASAFGPQFADAVFALRPGAWHGPIESGYGLHLVRVWNKDPGRRRDFAEVKAQLGERWREQKQREAERRFFKRLMEKYDVVLDDGLTSVIDPRTIKPVADTTR